MIILGIDPGYAITGYAVIESKGNSFYPVVYDHIATSSKLDFFARMMEINIHLKKLLKKYKPEVLAIEKIFFSKNTKTAINVAQVRGAIIQEVLNHSLEVYEYSPNEVKLAVTGYGAASKMQMQKMVKSLLNLPEIPRPDDTADALAVAICHQNSAIYSMLKRRLQNV
ncbi:MAG: crossover junction endodeoxyribonuclease RuvC [Candidatus Margulisbacteria bacterium]|nr:crossover junction endodeoxyribonuclease RuvC [Candidatus Margulisiibacteriota bacterium]